MTMSCPFKYTNILPLYYQTSPTPYTLDHMPPVDTLLTLGLIGALYILVLVCLLQNTKFRKKTAWNTRCHIQDLPYSYILPDSYGKWFIQYSHKGSDILCLCWGLDLIIFLIMFLIHEFILESNTTGNYIFLSYVTHSKLVTNEQWMFLVVILGGCSGRTRWSSSLDCSLTYTITTVAVP